MKPSTSLRVDKSWENLQQNGMPPSTLQQINKLMLAGNFTAAQKYIRTVAKRERRNAALQNTAGICHAQLGAHLQALSYFATAVKLEPENADFRANLTLCLIHNSRRAQARAQVDRLLSIEPKDPRPHLYLAMLAAANEDHEAAIDHSSDALKINPKMLEALQVRARAQTEVQNMDAALEDFAKVVELRPNDTTAQRALARVLNETGQFEAALAIYNKVCATDPTDTFALSQLAENCAPEAIEGVEWSIKKLEPQKLSEKRQRTYLELAKAHLSKRKGHAKDAMVHFARMHRLDEKDHKWKVKDGWRKFEHLSATYPLQRPPNTDDESGPTPILIVGLPRSGTTLVETVFKAHPDVFACGELRYAGIAYRNVLEGNAAPGAHETSKYASEYRRMLSWMPSGTHKFTDKMPGNYVYLGPLISAFPNARVIHIRRDPRDVALSMWVRHFPASGMKFTNRLEWIADQSNLYKSYMNHWEQSYPNHILSIDYETMVSDLEATSRTLATHCGLSWYDAMLRPEKAARTVKTASTRQVREKVHQRSVGSWKTFANDLKPFIDNLDAKLWPDIVGQK